MGQGLESSPYPTGTTARPEGRGNKGLPPNQLARHPRRATVGCQLVSL